MTVERSRRAKRVYGPSRSFNSPKAQTDEAREKMSAMSVLSDPSRAKSLNTKSRRSRRTQYSKVIKTLSVNIDHKILSVLVVYIRPVHDSRTV